MNQAVGEKEGEVAQKGTKTPVGYINLIRDNTSLDWAPVPGCAGLVHSVVLASNPDTAEVTRLTRFLRGADTNDMGAACHAFQEEIIVLAGRLYDKAQEIWLEAGHYACRPPGEIHGPFLALEDTLVLDISYGQDA